LRKRFFSKIVPVCEKNLSVSMWNLPGYFSVSFRFPQVTEFGKSTAIYLADSFCYTFLISKCRGDLDLGLCTSSVLAHGERMRDGKIRVKKRVSTQEKSDFAIALRFSKRKHRSCAQTYISVSSNFDIRNI